MSTLTNLSAEREVLAGLAYHGEAALKRSHAERLTEGCFADPAHRAWYNALVELVRDGQPITEATITSRLQASGHAALALGVGATYLELAMTLGANGDVSHQARILTDLEHRRGVARAGMMLIAAAEMPTAPVDGAVATAVASLAAQRPEGDRGEHAGLWEALSDLEAQSKLGGALPGIASGLPRLDELTDGWERGRLVVLAARPGNGKTAFGVWCAHRAAEDGHRVLFWTGEQPERKLQQRRLGIASNLDLRHELRQNTYQRHSARVNELAASFATLPLRFNESARTPSQLARVVQAETAMGRKPRFVVVDYLTKMKADGSHDRHDLAVGSITWSLARMAVDLDITVLLLAQLNRESVKGGKPRRPNLSDLRDSGEIEQDADQVIFLWEPPEEPGAAQRVTTEAGIELLVEKNRHGPLGIVSANWFKGIGRYEEQYRYLRAVA